MVAVCHSVAFWIAEVRGNYGQGHHQKNDKG
jgi:hypothetical protein